MHEGFFPRAAAIYKKILKIKPDEEPVQLNLGEISAKQGLLADAKALLHGRSPTAAASAAIAPAPTRWSSGSARSIRPTSTRACWRAQTLAQNGDEIAAAMAYRAMHADLMREGAPARGDRARCAKRCATTPTMSRGARSWRGSPSPKATSTRPRRISIARDRRRRSGAADGADGDRAPLRRDGRAPGRSSRSCCAPTIRCARKVIDLAWTLAPVSPEAAFVCIDTAVDAELASGNYMDAAAILQEFVTRVSGQIAALLKLVEICVDGGLEATMYEAQAVLADAYLEAGQGAEARVIAEDLVAREPWEHAHIDRFRRALVMLGVPDPDTLIADRLSGQGPFIATDPFMAPEPFGNMDEVPSLHLEAEPEPARRSRPSRRLSPSRGRGRSRNGAGADASGAARGDRERRGRPPSRRRTSPTFRCGPGRRRPRRRSRPRRRAIWISISPTSSPSSRGSPTSRSRNRAPPASLDEAFQDFRSEVSKQSGTHEAGEQLALARTYLEMGMTEEAIAALTEASRNPSVPLRGGVDCSAGCIVQADDPAARGRVARARLGGAGAQRERRARAAVRARRDPRVARRDGARAGGVHGAAGRRRRLS